MIDSTFTLPCGAVLTNRLAKAAMSEEMATLNGVPTAELEVLYRAWSLGGTGLLITGNIMIDPTAMENPRNVVLQSDTPLEPFKRWAEAGCVNGNQLWAQLNHTGRQTLRLINAEPVAPSEGKAVKQFRLFGEPRALADTEIEVIIKRFAESALRAKEAGFTGVQIHAAHGYLISQFLTPLVNKRTDKWGGSLENRSRLLREVIIAVRQAVGDDFPIGVKLNSADFQRGGFDEYDSELVILMLQHLKVDLIELSGGNYESPAMFDISDSSRTREAYFIEYAKRIRKSTSVPIMVTGGFRSLAAMQSALEDNALDVIGIGRPLALEPDLANKLFSGESQGSTSTPKSFGLKQLDYFAEGGYYLAQMSLISRGKKPNPEFGPWRAAVSFIWQQYLDRRQYQRVMHSHEGNMAS